MDKVVHFLTFTLFRFVLRENARSANEMRAKRQFFFIPNKAYFKEKYLGPYVVLFFKIWKLSEASAIWGHGKKNINFAILDHGEP